MRCTVDCPARGNCLDELQAECCAVFRANSNAGAVRIGKAAQCREREARKKDAAKPIPEAAYMQRVRAIADTMPPWLARAYTASRREAAGIREL